MTHADVDPNAEPDREHTAGGDFAAGNGPSHYGSSPLPLLANEDVVLEMGTTGHTFTVRPRGGGADAGYPRILPANTTVLIRGRGVASLQVDSADSTAQWSKGLAGTVFPLRPNVAAGSGLAASVQKAIEAASSVSTAKMYGLGTGGSAWTYTPAKTGIVRVTWDAFMLGSGNSSANFTMELLPTYGDSGVVAAPAAGASPPGGSVQPGSGIGLNPSGGGADFTSWNQHDSYTVILFLTAGHTYWFDFEASYNGLTAVALGDAQISFQELPA